MKKYIAVAALLAAGATLSNAAYVWNGGSVITSDLWALESSWTLTESSAWDGSGSGPQTPGSNMWDPIFVSDASGSIDAFEGWTVNLTLTNSNLTLTTGQKKFQGGSSVTIDANSSLTVSSFGYDSGNDGGVTTLNNDGTFNLTLAKNQGGEGFAMNLGSTGIVNVNSSGSHTVKVASVAAMLTADGSAAGIVSRTLVVLGEGASFDNTTTSITLTSGIDGVELTQVDSLDGLNGAAAGSYFLTKDTNGISVSYVIPEPSAFGLLAGVGALALVAARRRRK